MTGQATQIGDMGHGYASSGDIVSVEGFGTMATVNDGGSSDLLVQLAPMTFDATPDRHRHRGVVDLGRRLLEGQGLRLRRERQLRH